MSILLPVRDAAQHLSGALESLVTQQWKDFEVLLVDDGSRDDTAVLAERWAAGDQRLRLVRLPRRGIARALDVALREARAPLVARMDADDVALPSRLSTQLAEMERSPDLSVLGTHVQIVPAEGELTEGLQRYERWLNSLVTPADLLRDLFVESPLCHPTVMARREALLAVGGYRDVDGPEDYDLWLRLAQRGALLANLPQRLLLWQDHSRRATRRDRRYRQEAILRLKLWHLRRWRLAGAPAVALWGAGPWGKRWIRRLQGQGVALVFVVDVAPRKIGQTIHGLKVLSPDQLPDPGRVLLLVAVGALGAREQIRAFLQHRGWLEPEQFLCLQ